MRAAAERQYHSRNSLRFSSRIMPSPPRRNCHYETESLFHYCGNGRREITGGEKKRGGRAGKAERNAETLLKETSSPFVPSYGATRNADNSHCSRNVERNSRENENICYILLNKNNILLNAH